MNAKIVKLQDLRFGFPRISMGVTGYAIYVEGKGYLSFRGKNTDKRGVGIKLPYTPLGGSRALEELLETMDITDETIFEYVQPLPTE